MGKTALIPACKIKGIVTVVVFVCFPLLGTQPRAVLVLSQFSTTELTPAKKRSCVEGEVPSLDHQPTVVYVQKGQPCLPFSFIVTLGLQKPPVKLILSPIPCAVGFVWSPAAW